MNAIKNFFKLDQNNTTFSRELVAGATTFFAMVYIIFVNPNMLSATGMPWGGVFLATIFATMIGTLFMGLFANVPYALAPGMGLNAFFTYTVVAALGFTWQEALSIVFICGIVNVIITVTKIRKSIIKAIPKSLQLAIGGGIGLFIAYIGFKNAEMLKFTIDPGHWVEQFGSIFADASAIPALTEFEIAAPILGIIGLIITVVLLLLKVKGAILLGIIVTTIIGIPMGVTVIGEMNFDIGTPFVGLSETLFAIFKPEGIPSLFSDWAKLPMTLLAIFAFSLTDTFDTIGTFIGTGRKSGIFNDEEVAAVENKKGFNSKMEKALFADSIATSIGAMLGTSNTTTFVESSAGIEAGGRTGLTSVFTALFFGLCIFISPIIGLVPAAATAPALIIVGIMMMSSFKGIDWEDLSEAIPAFFASVLMALAYNISIGIAFGFIFYIIVKACQGQAKKVHPILYVSSALFLVYFLLMSLKARGII